MEIHIWLAFIAASTLMLLIPGPTVLTVIGYSLTHGRRAAFPLAAAVALGHATTLCLSIIGLGAILVASPSLFYALKLAGGVYLVFLIASLFKRLSGTSRRTALATADEGWKRTMFRTWLVTAINPQTIIFFVAFLPQFLDLNTPAAGQLWILSITFVVLAAFNSAIYAYCARAAAAFFKTSTSSNSRGTQHA